MIIMKVILLMVGKKDTAFTLMPKPATFTTANGSTICPMVWEHSTVRMEMNSQVNGRKVKNGDTEKNLLKMVMFTKATGKTGKSTARVSTSLPVAKFLKVTG